MRSGMQVGRISTRYERECKACLLEPICKLYDESCAVPQSLTGRRSDHHCYSSSAASIAQLTQCGVYRSGHSHGATGSILRGSLRTRDTNMHKYAVATCLNIMPNVQLELRRYCD